MLWFESHRGSFAITIDQVANLLCVQVNSTFYAVMKWEMSTRLWAMGQRPNVTDCGCGMSRLVVDQVNGINMYPAQITQCHIADHDLQNISDSLTD